MGVGSPRHVRVERRCEVGHPLRTDEVGPLPLDVAQRTGDLGGQSIAIPRQRQDPCPSIVLKAALGDEATQLQLVDDRADGLNDQRDPARAGVGASGRVNNVWDVRLESWKMTSIGRNQLDGAR